jgi:hypothetical protein
MIITAFWLIVLALATISTFLVYAYYGGVCTWVVCWIFDLQEIPEAKALGKKLIRYWYPTMYCILVFYITMWLLPRMPVVAAGG